MRQLRDVLLWLLAMVVCVPVILWQLWTDESERPE